MSGKHGRGKPGRSSQPDSSPSQSAAEGAGDTLQSVGAVAPAPVAPTRPESTVVYLPPRIAPTPPSLPPIRSAPLPGFASLLTPAAMAALSPSVAEQLEVAPEPVVEQVPEPVAPEPIVEQVAEPVIEPAVESVVEITGPIERIVDVASEPVVEAAPKPIVELPPEPFVELPPEPFVEFAPEPFVEFAPEPIVEPVVQPVVEPVVQPVPEPIVETVAEPIVEYVAPAPEPIVAPAPEPIVEHVAPAPDPIVVPAPEPIVEHVAEPIAKPAPAPVIETVPELPVAETAKSVLPVEAGPGEQILPSDSLGARGALREVRVGRQRRQLLVVLAAVVVLGLLGWLLFGGSGSKSKSPVVAAAGRTQTTLLIQLSGNLSVAVDSALLAHDPANHDGVVVLVPSSVVAQVPGFGSMPFGQALSVGDPAAPRSALSDLMGVTVDGSWAVSPTAFAALVDDIGGITVTVDQDVTKTTNGTTSIIIPAGTEKLDGANAVAFATFEAPGETEQARLARFDGVLKQVLAGLPKNQTELTSMLQGLGTGSVTSFEPAKLATFLMGLAADNAASATTDQLLPVTQLDTGSDLVAYTLDTASTAKLVNSELATSIPANRKITGNRIYVENQVGTPGIGESTRTKLEAAGFVYLQGENTDDMPNATAPSVVVIFGATSALINQGDAVARALGLPLSDVKVSDQAFSVADVVVKVGADYKG